MNDYVPIIGLEIHAELKTNSKLFCRCPNVSSDLTAEPNSAICPVCLGLPGALPVLNREAVAATVRLGQSLGADIPGVTKWDRKNYFYPDLPKGYQISQYDQPICGGGQLRWHDREGAEHSIELTRVHLEEDTGKLVHPTGKNYSLIDYNRSSVPLLELVTEPVIASAKEARLFAEEYQHHLRDLGVAEANMEKGQMRCEANVSVVPRESASDPQRRLSGTKIEVKNLNSFKSLEQAIDYEIKRQTEALETGESLCQETRGWNAERGETYLMRSKESSDDYRYFPEPDLPSLSLEPYKNIASERTMTRHQLAQELVALDVNPLLRRTVLDDARRLEYYRRLRSAGLDDRLAGPGVALLGNNPKLIEFTPEEAVELVRRLVDDKTISPAIIKETIVRARQGGLIQSLEKMIADFGEDESIDDIVGKVLTDNAGEVERYRSGDERLFGFFVGEARAALNGKGSPEAIVESLRRQLQ